MEPGDDIASWLPSICYVITSLEELGGAQIHVRDLSVQLARRRVAVSVVAGRIGALGKEIAQSGVSVIELPGLFRAIRPLQDAMAVWRLWSVFAQLKPAVVSLHSSKAGTLGRMAAAALKIPAVFTAHGWAFTDGVPRGKAALYSLVERAMGPLATKIVTVSEHDRALALKAGIRPARGVRTVHNGMRAIDLTVSSRQVAQDSPLRYVMVARVNEQKDHRLALAALERVRAERNVEFTFVGGGPGLGSLRKHVRDSGLAERVRVLGELPDPHRLLAHADVFVLASRWEGFPRSILEAMRAGLPVVASDVGGVSEAVVDGVTGILVPRGDVIALTNAMESLARNSRLRKQMGAAGRERFEARFTFERMFLDTLGVYREVLLG